MNDLDAAPAVDAPEDGGVETDETAVSAPPAEPEADVEDTDDDDDTDDVDHAVVNQDLRAMLAHYAPGIDIDQMRETNFNRRGEFVPPTKPKAKTPRAPKPEAAKQADTTDMTSAEFGQYLAARNTI